MSRKLLLLLLVAIAVGLSALAIAWLARSRGCAGHSPTMDISVSSACAHVDDTVIVTLTLRNTGCVGLGLPQYRLYVEPDAESPVDPSRLQPVEHSRMVKPGASDAAEFTLRAVQPGRAILRGTASFEVHLDYPGPAYWGGSTTAPLVLTVEP
jgi:hypothetical protein